MTIKNKIGFCNNKDLGIKKAGGHYVYINSVNKNGTCNVNVITSLEDKDKKFNLKKLSQVRKGNTYPIPKYDANFKLWSGVTKTPIRNVKTNKILNIGSKRMKKRHFFYIGKFFK